MLNVLAVMGRLVCNPEIRITSSGKKVSTFRIACNRQGKESSADFFDVVAWENTAIFVEKYFPKGSMIAVTGRLQSRNYQDKNGNNRTAIEIVAQNVSFCGEKKQETKPFPPANENALNFAQGGNDDFAPVEDADDLPF